MGPAESNVDEAGAVPDFDGKYIEVKPISERDLTCTFTAVDNRSGHKVFIKMLREGKKGDPAAIRFFYNEPAIIEMLFRLAPKVPVVPVLEIGRWQERPYFAQSRLSGWSLDKAMPERRSFTARSVLRVIERCLEFLELLHGAGVVHGDISPDNIFLETSAPPAGLPQHFLVRLVDFNSARRINGPENRHSDMVFLKSPYAAPELAAGRPLSPQSDLYALGVVFYEMLAGERPYNWKSLGEAANSAAVPAPPIPLIFEVPLLVEELIRSLLAARPDDRPGSASECLRTLRGFIDLHEWLAREGALDALAYYPRREAQPEVTPIDLPTEPSAIAPPARTVVVKDTAPAPSQYPDDLPITEPGHPGSQGTPGARDGITARVGSEPPGARRDDDDDKREVEIPTPG